MTMANITLIAGLFSLALTFAVLWINPYRFSNQAFALVSFLQTTWLVCVYRAMSATSGAASHSSEELEFWLRANSAIVAFLPASFWLLREAILSDRGRIRAFAKALPLYVLAVLVQLPINSNLFLFRRNNDNLARGLLYYIFTAASIGVFGYFVSTIIFHIRLSSGVRKVELQFLALTAGGSALIIGVLNILGNVFYSRELKNTGIIVLLAASALTAWALLFHRVFNAREVLIHLYHRTTFIVVTCGGSYLTWSVLHVYFAEPYGMLISIGLWGTMAVWLNRSSSEWFESGSRRKLDAMRRTAIEIGNTEVRTDKLILRFEDMLRTECHVQNCTLLFDAGTTYSGTDLSLPKCRPGFGALLEIGWTTPESLSRRKKTDGLADLQRFVQVNSLGLLIVTPRESPNPSLIIALGVRADEAPFTYPEVERLQLLAALLDNLLARARRVTHAALQARLEYLAVASRGLAHDLKNLITPVSSYLVHTEGLFARNSSAGEVHAAAQRSADVMSDYVRENLFFSEKLTPRLEDFEVGKLLEQVREVSQASAGVRNVTVQVADSCREHFVADRVLLQRMLVNLVSNAIDASAPAGIITVSAAVTRPGWIRFEVSDQGSGIAPENLTRIFDPYFTTKEFGDELRGFGLGLTIAQKIVLLHNGQITVSSRSGVGTTFSIELPSAQKEDILVPTRSSAPVSASFHSPSLIMP